MTMTVCSTGFSRKLVSGYKLPPEGGTTNTILSVTVYLYRAAT